MIDSSAFEMLAEFAIAQAGFASVVVVLGRGVDPFHPADGFRVFNALVPSVLAGFLALVPIGLDLVGVPAAGIWRLASFLFAFLVLSFSINAVRRMRRLPPDAREIISSRIAALHFSTMGIAVLACVVNSTTSWLGPPQGGFYFFGLISLLLVSAFAFVRLVFVRPAA